MISPPSLLRGAPLPPIATTHGVGLRLRFEQTCADLVEQAEAGLLIKFGLWLESFLHRMRVGEIVLRFDRDGEQVLEGIGQDVRKGRLVGDTSGKTNGSDVLNGGTQEIADVVCRNIQDGRGQNGAIIVHLADDKTVRKGSDVQLVQQCDLRSTAFVALCQDGHIAHDLDGT